MNLKLRLALNSTLVCALTMLIVFSGVYFFSLKYITSQYYNKLFQKALNTGIVFLEKDELGRNTYIQHERKYLQSLDGEKIQIYNHTNAPVFLEQIPDFPVDAMLLKKIRKEQKINFKIKDRQFTGLFYEDNQGDFVIIASGVNLKGEEFLYNLRWLFVGFFTLGILVNFLMNILVARETFFHFGNVLKKVNSITSENLHDRVPNARRYKDELFDLTSTLNNFLERLENEVNKQKMFFRNVSHELNTPLTTIIGKSEIALISNRTPEEYQGILKSIIHDTTAVKHTIEGLLLINGLEIGNIKPKMSSFRVDELIWEILERLWIKYPDVLIHTTLDIESDDEKILEVNSNKELLSVAITNLIDNSIKFSSDKLASIFISKSEKHLSIKIRNKGDGIPEDELSEIYQLFYRGNNTSLVPGQGIGLYLTKQIATILGLELSIESKKGEYTEASIRFARI